MIPRDPSYDPFSLEEQARRAADGLKPRRGRRGRMEGRLLKAIEAMDRAEEQMTRAFRRWDKARGAVRRIGRLLDQYPDEELPALLRRQAT
jgi:hypothetical protein